jgi:molybdopterin synthase sulfur carrier subunit
MKISIRFFASLKEVLKTDVIKEDLPHQIITIGDLRLFLSKRDAIWAESLAPHKNIRAAQNLEMVTMEDLIQEGAEIAFFPPVTGG